MFFLRGYFSYLINGNSVRVSPVTIDAVDVLTKFLKTYYGNYSFKSYLEPQVHKNVLFEIKL